jgi:hypothetical protein
MAKRLTLPYGLFFADRLRRLPGCYRFFNHNLYALVMPGKLPDELVILESTTGY